MYDMLRNITSLQLNVFCACLPCVICECIILGDPYSKFRYNQCCCQGLETQGRGQGQGVKLQGQGQGLENWSSRTRTFLEDNTSGLK